MDKASAPKPVIDLVERFGRNRDAYLSGSYNETQLRREFIDPFFEALGWDVENRQGSAIPYRDVIFEDSLKVGGATKDRKPGTKSREPGTDEVIRLTAGHQAKVEEKPEVRKAGEGRPAPLTRRREEAILTLKM